jgi:hypothetical protein
VSLFVPTGCMYLEFPIEDCKETPAAPRWCEARAVPRSGAVTNLLGSMSALHSCRTFQFTARGAIPAPGEDILQCTIRPASIYPSLVRIGRYPPPCPSCRLSVESFGLLGVPALTLLGDLADQAVQAGGHGLSQAAKNSRGRSGSLALPCAGATRPCVGRARASRREPPAGPRCAVLPSPRLRWFRPA